MRRLYFVLIYESELTVIAWMLKELPSKRPNIYEVVREACKMQGKEVPIRDVSLSPKLAHVAAYLTDLLRFTPVELPPRHERTRRYLPPQWKLLQSARSFPLQCKKPRSFLKLLPCDEAALESRSPSTSHPSRVLRRIAARRRHHPTRLQP